MKASTVNTEEDYAPILIAHRGLVCGPDLESENRVETIELAFQLGFMVECDIWYDNDNFWLGHDSPVDPVSLTWILDNADKLFVHCKNYDALVEFVKLSRSSFNLPDFFWHQADRYTLTHKGRIWAYPLEHICQTETVCVLPEIHSNMMDYLNLYKPMYICSKYCTELRGHYYGF